LVGVVSFIPYLFTLNQWIDGSFFFPARLRVLEFAGPEETKNQREGVLRLIQIRLTTPSLKKSRLAVKPIYRKRG